MNLIFYPMKSNAFLILLLSYFLYSCTSKGTEPTTMNELLPEVIELDSDDVKLKFISSSKVEKKYYSDTIQINGIVQAPPQSVFSVYSIIKGYIDDLRVYQGSNVKKGDILCRIKHPEILSVQQKFLSDYMQFKTDSLEYERQKVLLKDSATSVRNLEVAKNAYYQSLASYLAQEKLMVSLGFSVKNILNGNLYPEVVILSPTNGVVSNILVNQGSYIESNTLLFTIHNNDHLHIELFVSPIVYSSLINTRSVYFKTISDNTIREAEIVNISSFIENDTKSIILHCHPKQKSMNLLVGESVSAFALADSVSGYLVPRNSLFIFDDKEYVFIQISKNIFKLIPVIVSKRNATNFIINSDDISEHPIVTSGAEILKELVLSDE